MMAVFLGLFPLPPCPHRGHERLTALGARQVLGHSGRWPCALSGKQHAPWRRRSSACRLHMFPPTGGTPSSCRCGGRVVCVRPAGDCHRGDLSPPYLPCSLWLRPLLWRRFSRGLRARGPERSRQAFQPRRIRLLSCSCSLSRPFPLGRGRGRRALPRQFFPVFSRHTSSVLNMRRAGARGRHREKCSSLGTAAGGRRRAPAAARLTKETTDLYNVAAAPAS